MYKLYKTNNECFLIRAMEQIFSFGERWNVPFASLNGTFHLSPHENICTIALINICIPTFVSHNRPTKKKTISRMGLKQWRSAWTPLFCSGTAKSLKNPGNLNKQNGTCVKCYNMEVINAKISRFFSQKTTLGHT